MPNGNFLLRVELVEYDDYPRPGLRLVWDNFQTQEVELNSSSPEDVQSGLLELGKLLRDDIAQGKM